MPARQMRIKALFKALHISFVSQATRRCCQISPIVGQDMCVFVPQPLQRGGYLLSCSRVFHGLIRSGYFKQMILQRHFWKIGNTIFVWAECHSLK